MPIVRVLLLGVVAVVVLFAAQNLNWWGPVRRTADDGRSIGKAVCPGCVVCRTRLADLQKLTEEDLQLAFPAEKVKPLKPRRRAADVEVNLSERYVRLKACVDELEHKMNVDGSIKTPGAKQEVRDVAQAIDLYYQGSMKAVRAGMSKLPQSALKPPRGFEEF